MKQKDWLLIIVVVILSGVVSFFVSTFLFGGPKKHNLKVEIVEKITSTFPEPDTKYFNSQSVDPTQLIRIGDNSNTAPFKTEKNP